jgi:hypothetical protein
MANNLVVGPNSKVALVSMPFSEMGFTPDNCLVIYSADGQYKSWKPGRDINAINGSVVDTGYIIIMSQELDTTGLFAAPIPTGGGGGGPYDYLITVTGETYKATPRPGSGLQEFQGGSAYGIIQAAIGALDVGNKGRIQLTSGVFDLEGGELTIIGDSTLQPPRDQLIITGNGYSTILRQNTPGKHAIVSRNRASFVLRDMLIEVGPQSRCGIIMDKDGDISEIGGWGCTVENVLVAATSASYPAVWIKNTFDCHFPSLFAYNPNNDGVVIESSSGATIYGNSHFGYLRTYASPAHAGLRIQGLAPYRSVDMVTFANYECISALYGVHAYGMSACSFELVDIEYIKYPIWFDGDSTHESLGNKFAGGYVYPQGPGSRAITVNEAAGGNSFHLLVQSDEGADTDILKDDKLYRAANEYNLTLSFYTDPTRYTLKEPENTLLILKTAINGVKQHIPSAPLDDVSNAPATTFWVFYQGFLKKTEAALKYPTVEGYNATGKWGIDIYGVADYWAGISGDFATLGEDPVQIMGFESGDYRAKPYSLAVLLEWMGIKSSAFYDYQPAPLTEPFFVDPQANTQDPGNNTSRLATTAFVQAELPRYIATRYTSYEQTTGEVGNFNTIFYTSSPISGMSETVYLDGKPQLKTTYTVFTNAIVFNQAPAVRPFVSYFKA